MVVFISKGKEKIKSIHNYWKLVLNSIVLIKFYAQKALLMIAFSNVGQK